ncbi:MAG: BatA and WFA domain-containing protein, partial [Planctomycetales bacterium]|nr:BatA and WFA domain-containing protein [Planctomycetales bacterium]
MNLNFAGQFPMWGWQWLLLGLIPPAIVLLYFLKLRREPLEVPSTYLWRKAIEDLHVNSLWQRLRRNLLLFLQLLIVLLIILACFRPSWKGTTLSGNRFIFMIDTSASMSAEDVEPTRLDAAKRQVAEMIRTRLKSGDAGMLITFSDRARVEQPFTTNHGLLAQSVEAVRPTQRGSDITEALRVADGLANPDRGSDAISGEVADESELAANVFVFTDGQLRTTPDFSWGNLQPNYIAIGTPGVENVAITAVGVSRNPLRPDQMQAIVQVENFGVSDANV